MSAAAAAAASAERGSECQNSVSEQVSVISERALKSSSSSLSLSSLKYELEPVVTESPDSSPATTIALSTASKRTAQNRERRTRFARALVAVGTGAARAKVVRPLRSELLHSRVSMASQSSAIALTSSSSCVVEPNSATPGTKARVSQQHRQDRASMDNDLVQSRSGRACCNHDTQTNDELTSATRRSMVALIAHPSSSSSSSSSLASAECSNG